MIIHVLLDTNNEHLLEQGLEHVFSFQVNFLNSVLRRIVFRVIECVMYTTELIQAICIV